MIMLLTVSLNMFDNLMWILTWLCVCSACHDHNERNILIDFSKKCLITLLSEEV